MLGIDLIPGTGLLPAVVPGAFNGWLQSSPVIPELAIERRYGASVAADLSARGHKVEFNGDWSEGRISAARTEADGQMYAGANPRGMQGYAAGR